MKLNDFLNEKEQNIPNDIKQEIKQAAIRAWNEEKLDSEDAILFEKLRAKIRNTYELNSIRKVIYHVHLKIIPESWHGSLERFEKLKERLADIIAHPKVNPKYTASEKSSIKQRILGLENLFDERRIKHDKVDINADIRRIPDDDNEREYSEEEDVIG